MSQYIYDEILKFLKQCDKHTEIYFGYEGHVKSPDISTTAYSIDNILIENNEPRVTPHVYEQKLEESYLKVASVLNSYKVEKASEPLVLKALHDDVSVRVNRLLLEYDSMIVPNHDLPPHIKIYIQRDYKLYENSNCFHPDYKPISSEQNWSYLYSDIYYILEMKRSYLSRFLQNVTSLIAHGKNLECPFSDSLIEATYDKFSYFFNFGGLEEFKLALKSMDKIPWAHKKKGRCIYLLQELMKNVPDKTLILDAYFGEAGRQGASHNDYMEIDAFAEIHKIRR